MTNQPQPAAVWIDGDPLMEAIATTVWEQCRTEDTSLVVDDPRNIAAVAASVARAAVAPATDQTALSDAQRQFLTFALDLAFDRMVSDDGFTDEDEAALKKLRRMAAESVPAVVGHADNETHACGNCDGIDPDSCLTNPDRPKRPPMDPWHILGIKADDKQLRIVAYSPDGRTLRCLGCRPNPLGSDWRPITADDLDNGGVCTACGVDVLIPQQPKEA